MNECTCACASECEQTISHPSMEDHNWIVTALKLKESHYSWVYVSHLLMASQIQLKFLTVLITVELNQKAI